MFDIDKKIKRKEKSGINPIVAGVTGAVVGAGVAVVATQLKEEKTRKKVKETLINAKDQATDYMHSLKSEPAAKNGGKKIKKIARTAKKVSKSN